MELKLENLTGETLKSIIVSMTDFLSKEQCRTLQLLIEESRNQKPEEEQLPVPVRMSQKFVDEKMEQFEYLKRQIDEGELCLGAEEYEDYSSGYWDSDWITEYYDNQGIGEEIMSVIRFAGACVNDGRYQEANTIYEWLWEMWVYTDIEYGDPVDLEMMEDNNIIHTDLKQLALLTLYADYQVLQPEKRAEDMYRYFSHDAFCGLHMEEMFYVGREKLKNTEQFWQDWIVLLKTKSGDEEGRLLKEAVLYCHGIEGLVQMAEENAKKHPSLYLAAMNEYSKTHAYAKIEETGKRAMETIDVGLVVRSEIALKAAFASSCMQHEENMMKFCWECFRSDSTVRNFLRLFGTKKMAERYGLACKEVLINRIKENQEYNGIDLELRRNIIGNVGYEMLRFLWGILKMPKRRL